MKMLLHGIFLLGLGVLLAFHEGHNGIIGLTAYTCFLIWALTCVKSARAEAGMIAEGVLAFIACAISTPAMGRIAPAAINLPENVIAAFCHGVTLAVLVLPVWRASHPRTSPSQAGPQCQRCGYNLTGNLSGTCPECGAAVPGRGSAETDKE